MMIKTDYVYHFIIFCPWCFSGKVYLIAQQQWILSCQKWLTVKNFLTTSSRLASKKRRILGSVSFTYSSLSMRSPSASTISLHFAISSSTVLLIILTAFSALICLGITLHKAFICQTRMVQILYSQEHQQST